MTKGLVIVNTGDGKGKTTAALGMALRAWGNSMRPCVIQFIKDENNRTGERKAAEALGVCWHQVGDGFAWGKSKNTVAYQRARRGWELAKQTITAHIYDIVILDEITYAINFGWVPVEEVVEWLQGHKPDDTHIVLTGRDAPQALIDYADIVTEMRVVKHAYTEDVEAQKGVEF